MPTVRPSTTLTASTTADPGLTGSLRFRLVNVVTRATVLGPTTVGVAESVDTPGFYAVTYTAPATAGTYAEGWDVPPDPAWFDDDELIVTLTATVPVGSGGATEPIYTTADALRAELGVNNTTLTDDAAIALIQDAEDAIDSLLGAWPVNFTTGRKILSTNVLSFQWNKLSRATAKLAAALYRDPNALTGRQWKSIRGPDFAFSGPLAGTLPAAALLILNQSGLRRLTTQATGRISQTGVGTLTGAPIANGPTDPDFPDGLSGVEYESGAGLDEGW